MGHLVLGYPSLKASKEIALKYIAAGVKYLELQIPFSHPTADGPTITNANIIAVGQEKVSTQDCLDLIADLKKNHSSQEIVPMTYLNKVMGYGLERYCEFFSGLGIQNMIIPDLPFDALEAKIITDSGLELVPVIAPNISAIRLKACLDLKPSLIYIMSDFKITGAAFGLNEKMTGLIQTIRTSTQAEIGIGFGINSAAEVKTVLELADFAIVGSSLILAEQEGRLDEKLLELVD
jgi:tryptophan synthase alpha subunit